jgi:hypothetical protein
MDIKIQGVFYTSDSGVVVKGEIFLENNYWIFKKNNDFFISFYNLYLDSNKKVLVPKNDQDKERSSNLILDIIQKYEKIITEKEKNIELKKISPSYDMERNIALKYILEYKKIYFEYFTTNSYKYILDD